MSSGSEEVKVWHNTAESRYEATIDGRIASCEYVLEGGRVVFTHTFVPPELRGRGIAEKLVRTALDEAVAAKRTIVPACSYVAAFIRRHPEFQSLVA
ncbi:MAG TPA: GNAT family N-acetyltransferase [Opitutus sp.]|nr:GNAT family N-acetyltransferase [Opitutus sp.]